VRLFWDDSVAAGLSMAFLLAIALLLLLWAELILYNLQKCKCCGLSVSLIDEGTARSTTFPSMCCVGFSLEERGERGGRRAWPSCSGGKSCFSD